MNTHEIAKHQHIIFTMCSQSLSGQLTGCAALVFCREQSLQFTTVALDDMSQFFENFTEKLLEKKLHTHEQDVLLEIANIIITAGINTIVNMLRIKIQLSLPRYTENMLHFLLKNIYSTVNAASSDVVIITGALHITKDAIPMYLLIFLTDRSLTIFKDSLHDQH